MKGYFFAPPASFGLLSALTLTFPPGCRLRVVGATLDLTLLPATLGAIEPTVDGAGSVFRFEAVSGALRATFAPQGLLSGLIRTLSFVGFLPCSNFLFAPAEYEFPLGLKLGCAGSYDFFTAIVAFEVTESLLDRRGILGGTGRAFVDFVLGKAFCGAFFSVAFSFLLMSGFLAAVAVLWLGVLAAVAVFAASP